MPSQRVHMYVSTAQPAFSVNILEASFQLPPSPGGSETSGQLNAPSQMAPDLRVFSESGEVEAGTVPKQQVSLLLPSRPGTQGSAWGPPRGRLTLRRAGEGRHHLLGVLPRPCMAVLHKGTRRPCVHKALVFTRPVCSPTWRRHHFPPAFPTTANSP